MTRAEQGLRLDPPVWAAAEAARIAREGSALLALMVRVRREEDARLRREHPWRWRARHVRRWWRRRYRSLPVRWVGFGRDRDGWWIR